MAQVWRNLASKARRLMLTAGFVVTLVGGAWLTGQATAATGVAVSGRVYNVDSGVGYANVAVFLCGNNGYAYTDGTGNWHATVPADTGYCARIVGGAPSGLVVSALHRRPDVGDADTYEYLYAGEDCYHKASCNAEAQKWDLALDTNIDLVLAVPGKVPAAVAQPTVSPSSTPAAPVSPTAAPLNFVAKASGDWQSVQLSWKSAQDSATVKNYVLERSIDNQTWQGLADGLTAQDYQDTTVQPDVHYFYRVHAVATDGTVTDAALVDVVDGAVLSAATVPDQTIASSDKLASVVVSGLASDTTCTVTTSDRTAADSSDRPLIVGPYVLDCKTAGGAEVSSLGTVTWTLKLGDRMHGLTTPMAELVGANGQLQTVGDAQYDKTAGTMTFKAAGSAQVGVRATVVNTAWVNYAIIIGFVVLVLVVIAFVPMRAQNKQSYREYLRAKYYNL